LPLPILDLDLDLDLDLVLDLVPDLVANPVPFLDAQKGGACNLDPTQGLQARPF